NLISISYDGTPMISVLDSDTGGAPYLSGSVSVDLWNDASAYTMTVDDVIVNALSFALTANNDSYSVTSGKTLTVAAAGVLANDTGGSGSYTAVLATNALHGTLSLSANGGFTYTPANNFTGN